MNSSLTEGVLGVFSYLKALNILIMIETAVRLLLSSSCGDVWEAENGPHGGSLQVRVKGHPPGRRAGLVSPSTGRSSQERGGREERGKKSQSQTHNDASRS